jgi:hypothetical protein
MVTKLLEVEVTGENHGERFYLIVIDGAHFSSNFECIQKY